MDTKPLNLKERVILLGNIDINEIIAYFLFSLTGFFLIFSIPFYSQINHQLTLIARLVS